MKKLSEEEIKSFKSEFKELLKKYNITIYALCDGDTHGIYDEKFSIDSGDLVILEVVGTDLSSNDIV